MNVFQLCKVVGHAVTSPVFEVILFRNITFNQTIERFFLVTALSSGSGNKLPGTFTFPVSMRWCHVEVLG